MITHASATFPWRTSFSVHVEMYSRGSNSRGRRSSFTICWSRMARPRTSGRGKTFAGPAPVAPRGQAHCPAQRDADAGEEPRAEREGRRTRNYRGAAVRAGEFRLADRGVRATMIAVPTAVSGDVRELAAASRTRMERPRRLDFGSGGNIGLRFGDRDEHGRVNPFHDGFLQGPRFDDLRGDRRREGRGWLSSCRFLLDGLRFDGLSGSRPGFPLDLAGGLGRSRFGTRFWFLDALLHFGLAFERVEITQQSLAELLFRPCRIEIVRFAQIHEGGFLGLKDLQTNDWRSRSRLRRPAFRRLLL